MNVDQDETTAARSRSVPPHPDRENLTSTWSRSPWQKVAKPAPKTPTMPQLTPRRSNGWETEDTIPLDRTWLPEGFGKVCEWPSLDMGVDSPIREESSTSDSAQNGAQGGGEIERTAAEQAQSGVNLNDSAALRELSSLLLLGPNAQQLDWNILSGKEKQKLMDMGMHANQLIRIIYNVATDYQQDGKSNNGCISFIHPY